MGRNVVHPSSELRHRIGTHRTQCCVSWLAFSQPRIHHLLHAPGGLAKLIQAHHARTALERVECTPQCGHLGHAVWLMRQRKNGRLPRFDDFAGFFKEDIQQLLVVFGQDWESGCRYGYGWWSSGSEGSCGRRLLYNHLGNRLRRWHLSKHHFGHCNRRDLGLFWLRQQQCNRLGCMGCGIRSL